MPYLIISVIFAPDHSFENGTILNPPPAGLFLGALMLAWEGGKGRGEREDLAFPP